MKINKKVILNIFPFVFMIALVIVFILQFTNRPRVLVVMSYSEENIWERQIKQAMDIAFSEKAPHFIVNYFYLNIRDNNYPNYIKHITDEVHTFISQWNPQVLLLVDDDAQTYVGKKYLYSSKYNIVFAGINTDPINYGYIPKKNITGIVEDLHFDAFKQAIIDIFPNYQKMVHLSDDSTTSKYIAQQLLNYNWSPLELIESVTTDSIDEWMKTIEKANTLNAILVLSHFATLKLDNVPVREADVVKLTLQNAKVPMMGFFNFNVMLGVPMAISTSSFEQGEVAANLTIQILKDKKNPGDIPFAHSNYFDFTFNQKSKDINMPGLVLPPIYRSFSYSRTMFENQEFDR